MSTTKTGWLPRVLTNGRAAHEIESAARDITPRQETLEELSNRVLSCLNNEQAAEQTLDFHREARTKAEKALRAYIDQLGLMPSILRGGEPQETTP